MRVPGARSRTCVGQVLHARQVARKHFFFTGRTHLEMKLLSGKVASNTSKSPIIRFRVKLKSLTQIWKQSRWFGLGYFFCANDHQREIRKLATLFKRVQAFIFSKTKRKRLARTPNLINLSIFCC